MRIVHLIACGLTVTLVACSEPELTSPTSPTTTATTTTAAAAAPTVTDTFNATVPVGGYTFYSFTVTVYGTVNVTLNTVQGQFVPATVMLGVGLGTPSAEDCVTSASVTTAAGSAVHVTQTLNPGVYCARVHDIGNLFAPASVNVTVAYP